MVERTTESVCISTSPTILARIRVISGIGKPYRNVSAFYEAAALKELSRAERKAR